MTVTAPTPADAHFDDTGIFEPGRLVIPPGTDVEGCKRIAKRLHGLDGSLQWWWGDLMVYLEQWGEEGFGQVIPPEWRDVIDNNRQWHWVAAKFPPHLRVLDNPAISWSHHREVTSLETEGERTEALQMAARGLWSTRELKDHVKNLKGAAEAGGEPEDIEDPNRIGRDILISVPADRDADVEEVANLAKEFVRGELASRGIPAGGQGFVVTVRAR